MAVELKMFEALEWLRNNENPSALATNRFEQTADAIYFVRNLYKLGAVNVSVVGILDDPERIEEEGGPYADTLLVDLPGDEEKREKLLEVYQHELKEYGCNNGLEIAGWDHNLCFWWD